MKDTKHEREMGRGGVRALLMVATAMTAGSYLFLGRRGRVVKEVLRRDIQMIRERDPAARNAFEIVTCYPGFHALLFHRLAHALWVRGVPVLPRMISQFSRFLTLIEIHPGAVLGEGFFIDHGAGVVIGETTEVGTNCTIFQGVSLAGTGKEIGKRHPTLGDNVFIGAGSKILGSVKIGDNVRIGAGSVVIQDVPANSTVVGNPGRPVLSSGVKVGIPDIDYRHLPDPVAQAVQCLVHRIVQLENDLEEVCQPMQEKVRKDRTLADESCPI
jgi:serine O-acetyltransferase